jgi:Flp pilus assembly protein TadB
VTGWLAALLAAVAAWASLPSRVRVVIVRPPAGSSKLAGDPGWVLRWRAVWSVLAGVAAASFVSGAGGMAVGVVSAVIAWVLIGRTEPADERRRRRAAERDLPGLVQLLAAALETGCDVAEALRLVCEACPGPASDALATVPPRLALGLPAVQAWQPVLDDARLAPLGRALVRAGRSGASVTHEVSRLADELAHTSRATVEERARSVGVKAAVPLGLCLLPSFVLIGVVPLVVSLLQSLDL